MQALKWSYGTGAIQKAQPDYKDVHTDAVMTQISVAYMQDTAEFVAANIFPVVPVNRQSDKFKKYDKEDFNKAQARKRAPSTESEGSGFRISEDTYAADVWAFHKDVDDWVRGNADAPIDPDRDATEFVTRTMLLTREKEWVSAFFKAGVWTAQTDQTGVDAAPAANQFLRWNDAASTPMKDVRKARMAGKKGTAFRFNTMVVQEEVHEALTEHPTIADAIKYTQRALPSDIDNADLMARVFKVQRYIVMGAVEATGTEPNEAMGFMAGKHAWIGYVNPRPGQLQPSAGYIFSWRLPGVPGSGQVAIDRFRMQHLKSDRLEANMAWAMKVVSPDLGAFFATAIA
jgi:hypothetical protein